MTEPTFLISDEVIADLILIAAASKLPSNAPPDLVGAMDRLRELATQLGLPVPKDAGHERPT
jgi:hypothetical protein